MPSRNLNINQSLPPPQQAYTATIQGQSDNLSILNPSEGLNMPTQYSSTIHHQQTERQHFYKSNKNTGVGIFSNVKRNSLGYNQTSYNLGPQQLVNVQHNSNDFIDQQFRDPNLQFQFSDNSRNTMNQTMPNCK